MEGIENIYLPRTCIYNKNGSKSEYEEDECFDFTIFHWPKISEAKFIKYYAGIKNMMKFHSNEGADRR